MNFFKLIIITIIFTISLHAEYLRTIRLGSFELERRAQVELKKVKKFVSKHQNITKLQEKWDFKFIYRTSGKYYVIVAEPLRDRAVLQEVIDTLRLSYPDAYVTKLTEAAPFKPIKPKVVKKEEVVIPEPLFEMEVITKNVSSVEEYKEETIVKKEILEVLKEEVPIVKKEIKPTEVKKIIEKKIKREPLEYNFDEKEIKHKKELITNTSTNVYQILFFITLILLIIVSLLLIRYKRKNVNCKDRESYTLDLFNKKDIEIRHKDSFLSHAKTSVATIHNFTNLLLEFDLTIIQKDYVQRIRSSSEHLLNTVNNTLDITKLKNHTLKIENTEFDLNEMLRKVSKIISLEAKNSNTEFELNVENDVPSFIFGDPTRIRQVLINLLGNSVKYTQEGKISLTVKTLYNYTHAITLGFIVKDTGIGMTSEQLDDIHDASTEIVEGGTVGLGLSVTKQLIEMMQGEIKIYSTEEVGTTFTFSLKFAVKR